MTHRILPLLFLAGALLSPGCGGGERPAETAPADTLLTVPAEQVAALQVRVDVVRDTGLLRTVSVPARLTTDPSHQAEVASLLTGRVREAHAALGDRGRRGAVLATVDSPEYGELTAAVIGLGLNYSAYLGEIIRGAIQSIDHGQMEAAKAIGMSYRQAMRRVIIPQTYKRLMPPIGNEFIALIKDTALVSTIAMVELMRSADQLFNTYFNITALALAALIYLLLTSIFTYIFEKIEYRAGIYEHR